MDRPPVRLIVLFGGQSAEHEVSCVSAYHVLRAIDPARYDIEAIGITRDGTWIRAEDAVAELTAPGRHLPAAAPDRLEPVGEAVEPMTAIVPTVEDQRPVVVLTMLPGPRGEDGTVQGLLELADGAFVGSGVLGSAGGRDTRAGEGR